MAYRFTNTDKWSDNWFVDLKSTEKLLFLYLIDNCDIGGFFEISYRRLSYDLGIDERGLKGALKGLERGLIYSLDGSIVYLRTFLKNQKNLPLNPANKAHQGILRRFEKYADRFDLSLLSKCLKINLFDALNIEEKKEGDTSPSKGAIKGLLSPTGIGNGIDIDNNINNYNNKNIDNSNSSRDQEQKNDPETFEVMIPEVEDDFSDFQKWIVTSAPTVGKLKEPFTREQYEKIVSEYTEEDVKEILEAMHNYKPLLTKCVSANLTARNWLRRDNRPKRNEQGRKTAGNSKFGTLLRNVEDAVNEL